MHALVSQSVDVSGLSIRFKGTKQYVRTTYKKAVYHPVRKPLSDLIDNAE